MINDPFPKHFLRHTDPVRHQINEIEEYLAMMRRDLDSHDDDEDFFLLAQHLSEARDAAIDLARFLAHICDPGGRVENALGEPIKAALDAEMGISEAKAATQVEAPCN